MSDSRIACLRAHDGATCRVLEERTVCPKELIFRDYFRFSLLTWGSKIFHLKGPFGTVGLVWGRDEELFKRWQRGETGTQGASTGAFAKAPCVEAGPRRKRRDRLNK